MARAQRVLLFAFGLILVTSSAQAQSANLTCTLPSNWTQAAPTALQGLQGACAANAGNTTLLSCAECVCSGFVLFSSGLANNSGLQENSTDAGGFQLFSDYLSLCVTNHSSNVNNASAVVQGVQACLANSTFQSLLGSDAANVTTFCASTLGAPPPSPGVTGTPPPFFEESSSGEESSMGGEGSPGSGGVGGGTGGGNGTSSGNTTSDYPPGMAPPGTPIGNTTKDYPPGMAPPGTPNGNTTKDYPPGMAPPGTPNGNTTKDYPPGMAPPGTPNGNTTSDYPPGQAPPGTLPAAPRPPGGAAALSTANLMLQAAVAAMALLCSVLVL